MHKSRSLFGAGLSLLALAFASQLQAQSITTGAITGVVTATNGTPLAGARVVAVHEPSGTRYEARTRADGRVTIPGMRVGGPYRVRASTLGFSSEVREDVFVNLGISTDLQFSLREVAVALEGVTITGERDPIFNSDRTGAASSVPREVIRTLPSFSGRIEDFARLTPQASGMSFAGQDNRLNNITVDGSYFNQSFGIGGQPGDRTNVAPISLNAIEQLQINVAPYDVRQGNFVGAGVNTVTRSGTNSFSGSFYHQIRNQGLVGKNAGNLPFNPGVHSFRNVGGHLSGPILPNRLFFFFSYEDEGQERPGTTFRANTGSETVGGSVTRVKATDLDALSSYLKTNFGYNTGTYQGYGFVIPAKRLLAKLDFNLNDRNKISLRYNRLDSSSDILVSNSNSLGGSTSSVTGRRSGTDALNFQASNYGQLENIRSTVAEWNSLFRGNMSNNFIVGYTEHNESRTNALGELFPFVDVKNAGLVYTSFGFEPFSPNNELYFSSLQFQNNFSIFTPKHNWTFGVSAEHYESENVFFSGKQSVYVYSSLADWYTDANGYLANPNRTVSPVTLELFQVRYNNIPGLDKPTQPLDVWYNGIYAQDEWQVSDRLKVTAGLRLDAPFFGETGFTNPDANKRSFRDETGRSAKYLTQKLPDANIQFSPRIGFNWDPRGDRSTQVRGGSGVFSGRPAYVWISNQIGINGLLTGFSSLSNTTARPFHPDPNHYKPTTPPTGAPSATYELALTDPGFRFPQLWRTNVGVDQRLPWGWVGTLDFIYNKDVNGVYYINANLPAPTGFFTGADKRPRWVGTNSNRIHSHISNAIVMKNQNEGFSWNIAGSLERSFSGGFFAKAGYAYGISKNTVDPGSIAFGSWNNNQHSGDPNNPGLAFAGASPGHRFFTAATYRKEYFRLGATTLSMFFEARTIGNASYTFSGDLNGDGGTTNDLIYIPKDISEMNFQQYTQGSGATAVTFTAAEQAAAWEAYIQQDDYLSKHRGEYEERGAIFLPLVKRLDFAIAQEIFTNVLGRRNGLQIRADIVNFGNMLNKNWGRSQRLVSNTPLVVPTTAQGGPADAQGRAQYRLRNINSKLMTTSLEPTSSIGDVYRVLLGVRYTFN